MLNIDKWDEYFNSEKRHFDWYQNFKETPLEDTVGGIMVGFTPMNPYNIPDIEIDMNEFIETKENGALDLETRFLKFNPEESNNVKISFKDGLYFNDIRKNHRKGKKREFRIVGVDLFLNITYLNALHNGNLFEEYIERLKSTYLSKYSHSLYLFQLIEANPCFKNKNESCIFKDKKYVLEISSYVSLKNLNETEKEAKEKLESKDLEYLYSNFINKDNMTFADQFLMNRFLLLEKFVNLYPEETFLDFGYLVFHLEEVFTRLIEEI